MSCNFVPLIAKHRVGHEWVIKRQWSGQADLMQPIITIRSLEKLDNLFSTFPVDLQTHRAADEANVQRTGPNTSTPDGTVSLVEGDQTDGGGSTCSSPFGTEDGRRQCRLPR